MNNLIDLYIDDHKLSWAPTTLKSEKHRLLAIENRLNGDPMQLWEYLLGVQKPYTRTTTWIRIVHFWQWLLDNKYREGDNTYAQFRRKNARLFKNTYQTKKPSISFEYAVKLIKTIPNSNHRRQALSLLGSGERYSESIQSGTAGVVGKGSKYRNTFRPNNQTVSGNSSYSAFRRALGKRGLKPHDLRKLLASKLVEKGMNEADLMEVMGWSSIITAKAYLQPKKQEKIREIFSTIHEELK